MPTPIRKLSTYVTGQVFPWNYCSICKGVFFNDTFYDFVECPECKDGSVMERYRTQKQIEERKHNGRSENHGHKYDPKNEGNDQGIYGNVTGAPWQ